MDSGAPPVWGGLLVASLIVVALRRPSLSLAVVPVLVLCLVDLALVGRPMFRFGFTGSQMRTGTWGTTCFPPRISWAMVFRVRSTFTPWPTIGTMPLRRRRSESGWASARNSGRPCRFGGGYRAIASGSLYADVYRNHHGRDLRNGRSGHASISPLVGGDRCGRTACCVTHGGIRRLAAVDAPGLGPRSGGRIVRVAHASRDLSDSRPASAGPSCGQRLGRRTLRRGLRGGSIARPCVRPLRRVHRRAAPGLSSRLGRPLGCSVRCDPNCVQHVPASCAWLFPPLRTALRHL